METPNTNLQAPLAPLGQNDGPGGKKNNTVMMAVIAAVVVVALGGGFAAYSMLQGGEQGGPTQTTEQPKKLPNVKVGVMLPLSGGASASGYGELKGVQLAKKQLGASTIELVQVDSKCDAKAAEEGMKQLVEAKVVAVIGEACSSASAGAIPLADTNKIPMISPSASSPTLSKPGDYFFRVIPPDDFQGKFMAQFLYDKGYKKVSVLRTNEAYGTSLSKVFKEKFEALGGKVVTDGAYEPDDINLGTLVSQMKAASPDAIYLISNSQPSATASLKLPREAGIKAPFYGSDALNDNILVKNAGAHAEGLTVTTFATGTKAFKQAFLNEYPTNEQSFAAAQAYDAFHAIYKALEKGATTGEQIKQQLEGMKFDGMSGAIAFDANGEISNEDYKFDVVQVKDGAFTPVEQ